MSAIERGPQQIINRTELLHQNGPNRQTTLEIRNLLRRPEITQGAEADISAMAGKALADLRMHTGIRSEYGREDIVEGLGAIDHPAAQLVVAESFITESSPDGSPIVAKKAERILLNTKRIYPETLGKLLVHDAGVKELGLRIVEHNQEAGIMPDGNVDPIVVQVLEHMMTPSSGTERRGAILASLLYERTNGDIPYTVSEPAEDFLIDDLDIRIGKLKETNTFAEHVAGIVAANEAAARTAANIQELALDLPPQLKDEPEELKALVRLGNIFPGGTVERYKSLVALLKERTRENLSNRVAQIKAQEEIRQKQFQAQVDETNKLRQLELQEAQERQAQVRREQRTAELELVRKARQWFPHL